MSRQPRNFQPGWSYHVTTRCNNREFNLASRECREVFLYAIKKALDKYGFKLYALCIMSNHVHYLYDFSNYGTYDRLTSDGLTQWHPAFLRLGKSLEECAKKYRRFCQHYKPKAKINRGFHWGRKLLLGLKITRKGKKKCSPGQLALPWEQCQVSTDPKVLEVALAFHSGKSLNRERGKKYGMITSTAPDLKHTLFHRNCYQLLT